MKQLFKIALCAAAFAASIDVFAEILPISPTEGSIVPLLSASQKKLKEFSSPEERKKAIEADLQEKKIYFGKKGIQQSQTPVVFSWRCTANESGSYRILISETPDFANSIYLDSVKNKKLHVEYFRTIQEQTKEKRGFFLPCNMNVLGYSPEAVDFALLQTNTTKNGAREIRDIVERMLNRAYDIAITKDPTEQGMTGYLDVGEVVVNGKDLQKAVILKPEIPDMCIPVQS
jgi:hypothetical protein